MPRQPDPDRKRYIKNLGRGRQRQKTKDHAFSLAGGYHVSKQEVPGEPCATCGKVTCKKHP